MLFPTIEFAIFFAVVFPLTWLLNDRNDTKKWLLVAASYFFYAFWSAHFTLLLFGSSLGNYLLALWLDLLPDGARRRAMLWLGIAGSPGVPGYFKYSNSFVPALLNLSQSP